MTGEFTQAGNKARFALRKTGAAEVERSPTSTPVPKELEGPWVGEYVGIGNYARAVTLTLKPGERGAAGADFVVVGKQRYELAVDLVTFGEQVLRVESSTTGIAFEGKYADGELKGNFEQGSGAFEFPLVLKRKQGG